ncbi:MAG TPA: TolC family protein [Steroidobacteraceae bacterium]|nr:TolC family protein [Steroidobacteraceae bacterium]
MSGCAHYEAKPLAPTRSARAFEERSLASDSVWQSVAPLLGDAGRTWPPAQWDRAQLLAVALAENPELAVMRAATQVALAQQVRAHEWPNPELTLQSEYSRGERYTWLYGVGFDFLLLAPRQRRIDLEIAHLATLSSAWQLTEKTWQVRRALIEALSDWQQARNEAPLLRQLMDSQRHLVELQERRVHAGEDPPSELIAVRVSLIETEQQLAQSRAAASSAQSAAAAALGMPPAALDGVAIEWQDWGRPPDLDSQEMPALREAALLARADLASAINDYADSELRLQLAIARQYPEFHLDPGYYWDHGVGKLPLNLGLVLPVFNRNRGEIAEARAGRELAGQRMLAVQADIYGSIEAALREDALAEESVAAIDRQQTLADRQSQQAQLGLQAGAVSASERVAAQVVALQAALEGVRARARRQAARNALEDALHAPLSGPEKALGGALLRRPGLAESNLSKESRR